MERGQGMDAQAVVERFFSAYYSGDAHGTRETITDDFRLDGPFAGANDADEFLELAAGLMQIVRGHRAVRWVVEGDDIAALYEILIQGPRGVGALPMGGWFTVVADRLSSARLIYDSAAFDAILSSVPLPPE